MPSGSVQRQALTHFRVGMRNPNRLAWEPASGSCGPSSRARRARRDLVPDYLTSVKDGAFYGWLQLFGQNATTRENAGPCREELAPDDAS